MKLQDVTAVTILVTQESQRLRLILMGVFKTVGKVGEESDSSGSERSPKQAKRRNRGGPPTTRRRKSGISARERNLRRLESNERERMRMHSLNDAFEQLREVIPHVKMERKLSKIETLTLAKNYIMALTNVICEMRGEEQPYTSDNANTGRNEELRLTFESSLKEAGEICYYDNTKEKNSLMDLSSGNALLKKATNDTSANDSNISLNEETNNTITNMTESEIFKTLSLSKLQRPPDGFVNYVSKLVDLNLYNNYLHDLPSSLNMLTGLVFLNLNNNQLCSLPDVICELSNLRKLWACENKINQLPNNLGNLSHLEVLSLNTNQLTNLPNSCAKLNQLEICSLSANKFKKMPNCIAKGMKNLQYKKLETVILNETRFQKFNLLKNCDLDSKIIERIIAEMTDLEELIIGNNKVFHPNYFSFMPINKKKKPSSVKVIDIQDTGLMEVPKTIERFVNLFDLNLSFNNLLFLPEEICNLKNLSILIMDNNHLACLPENIGKLTSLKELKLRHNELNELPESINLLYNLEYMDLFDNEFESMPEVIESLSNLKGLDLEQNYFSTEHLWYRYKYMRDNLRNYWTNPTYGCEFISGVKSKFLSDSAMDLSPSSDFSESSSFKTEYTFNLLPKNDEFNEHWDTSEDSADEFDPHENKEPKPRVYPPLKFYQPYQQVFCPSDFHETRVITRIKKMLENGTLVWSSNQEEGQFEDP
ncbi:Protein dimmed [Melipona quadrifasciata]|uniref:Protein dimmed n=1 Tax=Melipona quadrifasciata TaxID=166423 RepID=A0A0M9A7H9_9HYME|nr:Protein dimmed [Melipona quadrifasciata]